MYEIKLFWKCKLTSWKLFAFFPSLMGLEILGSCNRALEIRVYRWMTTRLPCCVTPTRQTPNASRYPWARWWKRSMATGLWGSLFLEPAAWLQHPSLPYQWTSWTRWQCMPRWGMGCVLGPVSCNWHQYNVDMILCVFYGQVHLKKPIRVSLL